MQGFPQCAFIRYGKLTGQIPSVQYGPRRKGDIRDSVLSHEALQKELGPMTFTSLQDGLSRTLAYFFYPSVRRDFLEKDYHGPIGGQSLFGQRLS